MKCINKQLRLYKKELINTLRARQHSDPKSYRNLLNKADLTKLETMQKVSLDTFTEHFKNFKFNILNPDGDTLDPEFEIDLSKISDHNFELNSSITKEEVLKSLGQLNLSKAC